MRKVFRKIVCVLVASFMSAGLMAVAACDDVYKSQPLQGDISGEVASNGGFAVKKGGYVYFINGKQSSSADNTFGEVHVGAIMRISDSDLGARNYHKTQTVVPELAFSGNTNTGLTVYGDYVYYSTPSTEKNSDGEIQNSDLVFKRAKLDGSEVMKGYYAKVSDNTVEYRFVKGSDGVIYLVYVAKSEDLYGTAYTNIHSVNTQTGVDTLLAYNVESVMFDKDNVENPRIYYTMRVTDFGLGKTYSNYNQVYTVTADATAPNEYDFSNVADYDAEKDPLYVNCGKLVLDGIGMVDGNINLTQFNAKELIDATDSVSRSPYTFTLSSYSNGTLFYTRTSTNNKTATLFAEKDGVLTAAGHKPAVYEPAGNLLVDGSNASNFTYIFDGGELKGAFISNDNGLIKAAVKDGKLITDVDNADTFYLTAGGKPTVLFTQKHGTGNYVYFSESGSGANGYIVKRLNYDGNYTDYNKLPVGDDVNEYTPVRVLDIDCSSDWYMPEMFDGRIFFSSQNKNMTEYSSGTTTYSHIMVCDVTEGGSVMSNAQIDGLNDRYEKISKKIDEVDESVYENLKNAYYFAHYTGDGEYLGTLISKYVEINGDDEEEHYSKPSVEKYNSFITATGDWAEFSDKRTVGGRENVYANQRDYYYALLGTMTEEHETAYTKYVRETYLKSEPEEAGSWFEGLSTGAKAGFIIGVVAGGLLIIGGAVALTLALTAKRRRAQGAEVRKRVKVDTTDDRSVDVYSVDEETPAEEANEAPAQEPPVEEE